MHKLENKVKLFEEFNGIEDKSRLSEKITKILNEQIKNELESSQLYRSISCWMDKNRLIGGNKLFFRYADEELEHMRKIYNYLFEKNADSETPETSKPESKFKDIREVLEKSLEHENNVMLQWNDIANAALEEKDNDTYIFSQWFITEQREEQEKITDLLFKLDQDAPVWRMDEIFEEMSK